MFKKFSYCFSWWYLLDCWTFCKQTVCWYIIISQSVKWEIVLLSPRLRSQWSLYNQNMSTASSQLLMLLRGHLNLIVQHYKSEWLVKRLDFWFKIVCQFYIFCTTELFATKLGVLIYGKTIINNQTKYKGGSHSAIPLVTRMLWSSCPQLDLWQTNLICWPMASSTAPHPAPLTTFDYHRTSWRDSTGSLWRSYTMTQTHDHFHLLLWEKTCYLLRSGSYYSPPAPVFHPKIKMHRI